MSPPLRVALPKGRILRVLAPLLERAGIAMAPVLADDRTLVRRSGELEFLLLKPDDVPTYVELGAADLGVCGRDVLVERESNVYQPVDLGIGLCRLVVAGLPGGSPKDPPRVATKYPRIASAHFARRGIQAEIVYIQGSVELAPLVGLSDLIVDVTETGATLIQNGLSIHEEVMQVSSVLVANRASYKLERERIAPWVSALKRAVGCEPPLS